MIFSKKVNMLLLVSLIMQQGVAAAEDMEFDTVPFRTTDGTPPTTPSCKINYEQGAMAFVGTYLYITTASTMMYAYFAREADVQKNNPTINHDVIEKLRDKCLNNGVVIDHIYYNPNIPLVGNAAVLSTPFGTLLLLGSGYGVSINEKDVVPLSEEAVSFIMGHECAHVLHNDLPKRKLIIASMVGLGCSNVVSEEALIPSLGLFIFGLSKCSRHQEYNADYYASTDPKVIKAGSQFFKDLHAKGQYKDILARFGDAIDHMLFGSHPCSARRSAQLELRVRELQKAKRTI